MIKIMSFFHLPIESERIGKVYSIANTIPRRVYGIHGTIVAFVPPWAIVHNHKHHHITDDEFTAAYRKHILKNWSSINQWLQTLTPQDEMYLCCWEEVGFCHRYLLAKLIRKFRPDLQIRVT